MNRREFAQSMAQGGALAALAVNGCVRGAGTGVVVYCALDSEYAQPLLTDIAKQLGIAILPKFDVESTKTVGLVNAIMAEGTRPRCDLFWNNEILNTVRLAQQGLLAPLEIEEAKQFPESFRDPEGYWCGFAARARVLLVNTLAAGDAGLPTSLGDLARPVWQGRCSMAKPLFGTTASHAAVLFATWGQEKAKDFFASLKRNNIQIAGGNKGVAQDVAAGVAAVGWTDTDDAFWAVRQGAPVKIVYPDQEGNGEGVLVLPNTLSIVRGAPKKEEAKRVAAQILSQEVERKLAEGASGQIPLHPSTQAKLQTPPLSALKRFTVNWKLAAQGWDQARRYLEHEFLS